MPRLLCIEIFLPATYSLREHSLVWRSRTQKGSEDIGVSKVVLEIEKEWNLILKKKKRVGEMETTCQGDNPSEGRWTSPSLCLCPAAFSL